MSIVKSRRCEVLIDRMNLKAFKRINRSNSVLPNITNYIIETLGLEHVNRIRRQPVLEIDVSYFTMFPII